LAGILQLQALFSLPKPTSLQPVVVFFAELEDQIREMPDARLAKPEKIPD
jgi:hypothetical protein